MPPDHHIARPRRSVLYMPASNIRAIDKARTLPADAVVFDLEDAVAPAAKPQARENLIAAFAQGGFGQRETVIRTNSIGGADFQLDLQTIARCKPDAVLLPKVSSVAQVQTFNQDAAALGLPAGLQAWFMIETVPGLVDLAAIVRTGVNSQFPLTCLAVGTNDIAKDTGVSTGNQRQYLVPWLMNIVLHAKAAGVVVLDGVWNDFKNTSGFDAEALQSVAMGFDGKTLIHPSQIESANRLFSPDPAQVAQARKIVAAFELPEHAHAGVINLDGEMVERLHLAQAQTLLALAGRIDTLASH
ncbi:MAG: CoA ester lyase [Burkholderiaceae bacterium]